MDVDAVAVVDGEEEEEETYTSVHILLGPVA
jgi:hypothetical protein